MGDAIQHRYLCRTTQDVAGGLYSTMQLSFPNVMQVPLIVAVPMERNQTVAVQCRNAYIMVAVHGSGYCTSAFHAAKLILNNILRIAAVNTVGDALIWLGKV